MLPPQHECLVFVSVRVFCFFSSRDLGTVRLFTKFGSISVFGLDSKVRNRLISAYPIRFDFPVNQR